MKVFYGVWFHGNDYENAGICYDPHYYSDDPRPIITEKTKAKAHKASLQKLNPKNKYTLCKIIHK